MNGILICYGCSKTMGTGSCPGVKRPGYGIDDTPTYSIEVQEEVELHLYSPSGRRGLI